MGATVFTDRSNRREKACKKEESIYGVTQGIPTIHCIKYWGSLPHPNGLGAVMRKLVHLCFGVLKTRQPYQPNYGISA